MTRSRSPEALSAEIAKPLLLETPALGYQFAAGYERWFDPVYAYVSRYVAGRATRERVVRQVLAENLDLLVGRREDAIEAGRLQATADRLIADIIDEADRFLEQRRRERLSRVDPH